MIIFDVHGLTGDDAPTIVLSSGLGGAAGYWAPQIAALAGHFRVVTYDHHGTGRSGGVAPEAGGIAAMADDVVAMAASLGLARFAFIGHALGGLIGLDLALRHPQMIERLVLVNAWSKADLHSGRCFDARIALLRNSGIEAFVKAQPLFLYPAVWMSEHAERLAADDRHGIAHFQGETNILRRIAALRAFDIDDRLDDISLPTLVLASRDDLLVPYTRSVRLAQGLANAALAVMEYGAHAVNIVDPAGFNRIVLEFLIPSEKDIPMAETVSSEKPEPVSPEQQKTDYRNAMARLGAAVNIVTTDGEGGMAGFAATAVCSVTDSPPTLLVCLNRGSSAYPAVNANRVLCVNVLGHVHENLSRIFGGKTPVQERFEAATWSRLETGSPVLEDALVSFDCRVKIVADGGTHDILICEVVAIRQSEGGRGLIYFDRQYHGM